METSLQSISLLFLVLSFLSLAQSSTIGFKYISRLLEVQDRERASPSVQVAAAYGLLHRLLPSHSSAFEFRIISKVFLELLLLFSLKLAVALVLYSYGCFVSRSNVAENPALLLKTTLHLSCTFDYLFIYF